MPAQNPNHSREDQSQNRRSKPRTERFKYGMNPGRLLKVWLWLMCLCWFLYFLFIRFPSGSRIYRIQKNDSEDLTEEQILPRSEVSTEPRWRYPFRLLSREMGLLFWAGFFSLLSALNIGFRELNLGQWLRLLPRKEYDLKAKGWARTIAGLQSVISLYLIALWVLAYFGKPFD